MAEPLLSQDRGFNKTEDLQLLAWHRRADNTKRPGFIEFVILNKELQLD
jgi:hypothetical protein